MTMLFFAVLVFLLLQLGDVVTTLEALRIGGREANPVMARLFEHHGPAAVLLMAKAVLFVLVIAFLKAWRYHLLPLMLAAGYPPQVEHVPLAFLVVCDVVYMAIVLHNLAAIREQHRINEARERGRV